MEFPDYFAHIKLPWFTHHENSVTTHGLPTMVIPMNIHEFNLQFSMVFQQTMASLCGQNDMKIPWKPMESDHGNSMALAWYYHVLNVQFFVEYRW